MPVRMQAARQDSGSGIPLHVNEPLESSQTFEKGTVLKLVSGEFQEVTVDTDNGSLYAVSTEGCSNGESDDPSDVLNAVRITEETAFLCEVWDGSAGAVLTDLSGLSVGQQGDLDASNGVYRFDDNSSASAALEIVAIFDDLNLVLVKFLESVIDQP